MPHAGRSRNRARTRLTINIVHDGPVAPFAPGPKGTSFPKPL
jgi:hypothetical protein